MILFPTYQLVCIAVGNILAIKYCYQETLLNNIFHHHSNIIVGWIISSDVGDYININLI